MSLTGKLRLPSKAEIKARKEVKLLRSTEGEGMVASKVYLVLDNHRDDKGNEKVGYGKLFKVSNTKDFEEKFPDLKEDQKVTLYKHGERNPIYFLAPENLNFLQQISWIKTSVGYLAMVGALGVLFFLWQTWQFIYLPQMHYTDENIFWTENTRLFYVAILSIGGSSLWYWKTSNAFRIQLRCMKPHECEYKDIHYGIIYSKQMNDAEQWEWWNNINDAFPSILEHIEQGILKQLEEKKEELDNMEVRMRAIKNTARSEVYDDLAGKRILSYNDPGIQFMRACIVILFIVLAVVSTVFILTYEGSEEEPEIKVTKPAEEIIYLLGNIGESITTLTRKEALYSG